MVAKVLGLGVALALLAGCAGMSSTKTPETPEQAAQHWAKKNAKTFKVAIDEQGEEKLSLVSCTESGFLPLRFMNEQADISLFFNCRIGESLAADQLPGNFSHVIFDKLPHEIYYPEWNYRLLTPASSVSEGVTFEKNDTVETVKIKTPLYAVYGLSETAECQTPADAATPAGCFVHQPVSTELEVEIKFTVAN